MLLKKVDGVIGSLLARLWSRPTHPGSPPYPVSRLLLIRPGGIGDAVLLAPAIRCLREAFPEAYIEVMAEKRNSGAFALCPGIDRVLCYDRPQELWAAISGRYNVVIDSEQWHRLSAIVARMIRSKIKIGYGTNDRKRMFTHAVTYSQESYELNNFFELLKPLGQESPVVTPSAFLTVPEIDQIKADSLLRNLLELSFVVLFPGASTPEKCWGVEKFRQLAIRLINEGLSVVVVGGREDVFMANAIADGLCVLNLTGKTSLCGTAGVLNRSKLLISGDSGVLHIGMGLGTSTISLFGPGNSEKWAPRGSEHITITQTLPCSPCTRFGTIPPCPIGVRCMQNISVNEVFTAAQKLLNLKQEKGAI